MKLVTTLAIEEDSTAERARVQRELELLLNENYTAGQFYTAVAVEVHGLRFYQIQQPASLAEIVVTGEKKGWMQGFVHGLGIESGVARKNTAQILKTWEDSLTPSTPHSVEWYVTALQTFSDEFRTVTFSLQNDSIVAEGKEEHRRHAAPYRASEEELSRLHHGTTATNIL